MQDDSLTQQDRKYDIKSDLEEIKSMVSRRRTNARKSDSLKDGAISDLKK